MDLRERMYNNQGSLTLARSHKTLPGACGLLAGPRAGVLLSLLGQDLSTLVVMCCKPRRIDGLPI